MPIDDRRVVANEVFFAGRGAVVVDQVKRLLGERFGQFLGVRDRRRAGDELGLGAVELADPAQPPKDVRQVGAEDAAIGVELVDDDVRKRLQHLVRADVAQAFEEPRPLRVMRQDSGVQHVRVGEDDVGAAADLAAGVAGCVAVIGKGANIRPHRLDGLMEILELILAERLGGK